VDEIGNWNQIILTRTKLFCKSIEKPAASGNSNLYIEVYNYGNSVAQNIGVSLQQVFQCFCKKAL